MTTESRIASAFQGVSRRQESVKRGLNVHPRKVDLDKIDNGLRCIEMFMLQRLPLTPERWARMIKEHKRYLARRSENNICSAIERLITEHDPGEVYKRVKERHRSGCRWKGSGDSEA